MNRRIVEQFGLEDHQVPTPLLQRKVLLGCKHTAGSGWVSHLPGPQCCSQQGCSQRVHTVCLRVWDYPDPNAEPHTRRVFISLNALVNLKGFVALHLILDYLLLKQTIESIEASDALGVIHWCAQKVVDSWKSHSVVGSVMALLQQRHESALGMWPTSIGRAP